MQRTRALPLWIALVFGASPAASPAQEVDARPNVLVIFADDLTACLGSDGHPVVRTPHLDRLAREGARFAQAHCQFPLCGPSRASILSGLYPDATGMLGNSQEPGSYQVVTPELADHPSLGDFFRANGWFTARVSKVFHMGVPGGIEQGSPGGDDPDAWDYAYDVMGPETLSPGERRLLSPSRKHYGSSFAAIEVPNELADSQTDALAVTQAIAILESRAKPVIPGATNKKKLKPDAPFFLAVGLVRPHVPLVAPERSFDLYPLEDIELPFVPEGDLDDVPRPGRVGANASRFKMTEASSREALQAYYASVSFLDEQVGRLLDTLDRLDLRDDTIVVFLSDHGWNLGEHGCWQKSTLWQEVTRVPLLISVPGMPTGLDRGEIVELIDLYPTLVDLCGLADQAPGRLQGESLKPLLEGAMVHAAQARTAYTRTLQGHGLRMGSWRYSDWGDAGEELYDLANDPREFTNLVGDAEHAETLARMRAELSRQRALARTR